MDSSQLNAAADTFLAAARTGAYPAFHENGRLTPRASAFLLALYADAADEAAPAPHGEDLLALAHALWQWAETLAPDERGVRLRPALGAGGRPLMQDVLEIAGPDMPFLVDSVMGELADQGVSALAMAHPIAPGRDGAMRSYIQILLPSLHTQRAAALLAGVRATLDDVGAIVADFGPLKARMLACAADLKRLAKPAHLDEVEEAAALLSWLAADRFTFLGVRDYEYARGEDGAPVEPLIVEGAALGLLRDPQRYVLRSSAEPMLLTPEWRRLLEEPSPLVVAKSTLRSRVHRRAYADYVGVKRYDGAGRVVGETRFIGLFTTEAFTDATRDIPVLRRKAAWVIAQAGFRAGGHSEKSLRHVIETFPREELWQITREELLETARGIVHLMDRPRPRVFWRRDPFGRFVSALAYLPKDRFNSRVREAVGRALEAAFGGRVESFIPLLGESPLARVHFTIADIDRNRPNPDQVALDAQMVTLTRTWEDAFDAALNASSLFDEAGRDAVRARFEGAFSAAYRERFDAEEALADIADILAMGSHQRIRVRAYRKAGDDEASLRCKIVAQGASLPLSETLPILENLGLFVVSEQNFELRCAHCEHLYVHDLEMRAADGAAIAFGAVNEAFEEAFEAIWSGLAESDGFNRIILKRGVRWREAALLRALARYRQQSGLDPSQRVQEHAIAAHAEIAALILALFRVRFDPDLPEDSTARRAWSAELEAKISTALNGVQSLDDDRVLRRLAALVAAIVRTNYYQRQPDGTAKPYMSFKIASNDLADLPAPKPYREIWVSSPRVEGVHLRFGPVARGGLRWSDRRDDFRTEVLDLVKAQQVKNAIIVPVGAKGGFFPKQLPPRGAPGFQEAGVAAYRTFLRGLLDITDNLHGESVAPPERVVRWDGDDPYLVVAADKGTATFSDIANAMAQEYGFWLGDAFASGGSVGYDHKAMGITARGAWEAVKRHFREIGKDIQTTPFDVIGVGDMSGDVFGNGMLLSKKIRLIAAFDHRHIFIDPNPGDLDAAWAERKRLFDLPRSSWDDYDRALISAGGGVFARSLKSISITPEIAAIAHITEPALTPADFIRALLKARCELLWFGGIGAFIKARAESHADVGDKANDLTRVDAEDVQALVIGEGANLGVTQAGRIAFARKRNPLGGGRINTDAVDNSAGVDTSDHEVNIKILLAEAIRGGALAEADRHALLSEMTDDVAALVLRDNYDQTGALSLAEASAIADLDSHERLMQRLEAAGKLSRAVEGLPSAEDLRALRAAKQGLTRPELAKLIAYAKIDLFDAMTASSLPDDPAFEAPLMSYFPPQLARFKAEMGRHRLRREIIATYLADDLVNLCGPTFVDRVRETVRAEPVRIMAAFEAGRRIFAINRLTDAIEALDNKVDAALQTRLRQEIVSAMRRIVIYLARHGRLETRGVSGLIAAYAPAIAAQRQAGAALLSPVEAAKAEERRAAFVSAGAPPETAAAFALLAGETTMLDAADIAQQCGLEIAPAARLHRALGAALELDALRLAASDLRLEAHWDRLAMRRGVEETFDSQRVIAMLAARALGADAEAPEAALAWLARHESAVSPYRAALAQLGAEGGWTFAKFMLAMAETHALVAALNGAAR